MVDPTEFVLATTCKVDITAKPCVASCFGAALYLGETFFLTAAHVADTANPDDFYVTEFDPGLGYGFYQRKIVEIEQKPDIDVAMLKADFPPRARVRSLTWSADNCTLATRLYATGFPFSVDKNWRIPKIRTFQGNIVSQMPFDTLAGNPLAYELDFACPRGMSGAPLVSCDNVDNPEIRGLVIGNHRTDQSIFREKEIIEEDNQTTIIEHYDSLSLGIAVHIDPILRAKYDMIGEVTLADYLGSKQKLTSDE